ncbi:MAG: sodium:calcium antiporter [Candidatus Paceibacterota bacterium]
MSFVSIMIIGFSLAALVVVGRWVIYSLVVIARYFGFKEFVVAFFTVSIGAVLPEFFVGVTSALQGIPEVSLGNVIGENLFLLTVTVALATFFSPNGLIVDSKTVRGGIVFTALAAVLPLMLILDGDLSRIDGFLLLACFGLFVYWLFSKKERFIKIYEEETPEIEHLTKRSAIRSMFIAVGGVLAIVISVDLLLTELLSFSDELGTSLAILGLFVLAIGTALPETYFAVDLARRGNTWMVLGGIMGGIAMASTLVLGVVSLITPIVVEGLSLPSLVLARIFLTIGAILLLVFVTTDHVITRKEGAVLLAVYISFLLAEILIV